MKAFPSILVCAAIVVSCGIPALAQSTFRPARVTFATDVQFPITSIASGIVVVDVSIDSKGAVTGTAVQRDIASLTSVATSAVRDWKYTPAYLDGTPQPSVLRVAFAFRPRAIMAAPPSFAPLQQDDGIQGSKSGYIPPGILAVAYPAYPIDAASVGAVAVQLRVNADGKIDNLKIIRAFPPFTRFSLDAAKKWQFRPATLNREPVASNIAIAFVYATPAVSYR